MKPHFAYLSVKVALLTPKRRATNLSSGAFPCSLFPVANSSSLPPPPLPLPVPWGDERAGRCPEQSRQRQADCRRDGSEWSGRGALQRLSGATERGDCLYC